MTNIRLFLCLFLGTSFLGLSQQPNFLKGEFFEQNRTELRAQMPNNSVAVFFSNPIRKRSNDVDFVYHQDPNFYYLTGWEEPHAVLIVFKDTQKDPQGDYQEILFVRERNARDEMWNGERKGKAGAETMGFDRVALRSDFSTLANDFDRFDEVLIFEFENDVRNYKNDPNDLFDLQSHFKKAINYPNPFDRITYSAYQQIRKAAPDQLDALREKIKRQSRFYPQLEEDPFIQQFLNPDALNPSDLKSQASFLLRDYNFDVEQLGKYMANLREVKKPEEVVLLKRAIEISAQGQIEVMKAIRPGMTEREIQGIHQLVYKKYGAAHEGYPSIVGAGHNGCILHYIKNDKKAVDNQLILMDLGAEYQGYTADVTRTIPINGKFTKEQRLLYEIVVESQQAGIDAARAGASFRDITNASYAVVKAGLLRLGLIEKESEFRRYLPHGVAHHIGLDVHDPGNYGLLAPNMVITVEPGIYVPANSPCDPKWWDIGIRIEDDIRITEGAAEVLSAGAPRDPDAIEAMIAQPSPLDDFDLPDLGTIQ
ncbi:MAG: aminopeptidase P N-terminal domain-containing protein [Flavobacteriaceae bacterium]